MSLPRLEATHRDAIALRALRRPVPVAPGLRDFRAILHAHAEDSSHTGGTRPEMLADAKTAGVAAILLTDHHRPPRDFIDESWRGLHEDVLFIPGSEDRGFLLYPTRSVMSVMKAPESELISAVRADGGLAFLSHIEERPDHSMENLDGMEIYNRHADAKKDRAGILALVMKLTDPAGVAQLRESLERFPDELLAFQVTRLDDYLAKWDRETATRRLTGVAANDCHHNQVFIVKMVDEASVRVGTIVDEDRQMQLVKATLRPGIRAMTKGHKPGDILVRLDFDPYRRSFVNSSTHALAPELTEPAIRAALRAGHAYVSHDWICDPTGFSFRLDGPDGPAMQGDEWTFQEGGTLHVRTPIPCRLRLLCDGKTLEETKGDRIDVPLRAPGVYRVEASVILDEELRPWIYSNPIYVRARK